MAINPPLLALAVGAFGIGMTEFTPMGMLPLISGDLGVSIPAAGLVVSAYAIGVLVGAPVLTLATARVPRRRLLVGLMGIFTLGNLLAAVADSYAMLVAARIVTSLNHGAFFGVGSVVAASLAPPERRAAAVATMFSGLTIATIGGVPLAAWIGEEFGWRAAFWGIAGVGALTMISLRLALPPLAVESPADMRAELRVLRRLPVLAALALTMIGFSSMFTVFTYIVPILKAETGAGTPFVTTMLVVFGVGLTIGNWLGGRFADRSVDGAIFGALIAQIVILVLFIWGLRWEGSAAALIFLWGIASFAIGTPLQMRAMQKAKEAPNLASAMNIGAFNLGNAIGAAVGGGVIDAGLGLPAVSLAGAVLAGAGLLMLIALRHVRSVTLAPAG
ncbi:MFS transporter [Methylobacterium persicinum]|uniref:DHA1 family inner membrane transport protein n=1 Tax=Methylobacterium persicinum TaxID=374426 RepID=A0ABU0HMQ9_9HYPH|nr:MFS transporter [Methylobacterium persicinum]MDQ0442769.1 DHA1 family inner membrane transport protein [Methylobacterium persicinum]GJE36986.1 Inner membrane transport protein YdhP [Methylobacterium persicinum]